MDTLDELFIVGLSHRTAPVAVREQYAVQQEDTPGCLAELCSGTDLREAVLVSTCNRTEVLVVGDDTDPEAVVRRQLFRNLDEEHLYVFRGVHAVIHFFRVVCGMDSLVPGESEIQAQVKHSVEAARSAGTLGPVLDPLTSQALSVGKRVRSETELGQGTLSVAKVAVDVAQHAFGNLADNRALVVGAGQTGLLVARHLRDASIRSIDFANRTIEHAQDAAREFRGEAFGLDEISSVLDKVDIVVACVNGGGVVLDRKVFDRRSRRHRDRPQIVVDLSVPRAVDAAVADLDGVLLFDLDDLEPVVERNRRARGEAGEASAEILVAEVHKFLSLRTYAAFSPAIAELRERFYEVREETLDEITTGSASARELELAHELAKRLLDLSLSKMKEGARRARSEAALDREYQRFLENL